MSVKYWIVSLVYVSFCVLLGASVDPKFSAPISNVTVPVGREGVMTCRVHDLHKYKVAWLRVDTQTILTIERLVVTKSDRITVTHTEQRIWQLRIKDIKESDKGWYMCQINTDPMKSQMGYLNVVVPPDISDHLSSQDMTVIEGSNVTLTCVATGVPDPSIQWKRPGEKSFNAIEHSAVTSPDGSVLDIYNVQRYHTGEYHCKASNGVSPSMSKRIMVTVDFAPVLRVANHQLTAELGQRVSLECFVEAHPEPVTYWVKNRGDTILPGVTDQRAEDFSFKVTMQLIVHLEKNSDFGSYRCVAKNAHGISEGYVKIQKRISKIIIVDEAPTLVVEEPQSNNVGSNAVSQRNQVRKLVLRAESSSASALPSHASRGALSMTILVLLLRMASS